MEKRRASRRQGGTLKNEKSIERRVDIADGSAYTYTEFIAFYGDVQGPQEWENSKVYTLDRMLDSIQEHVGPDKGSIDAEKTSTLSFTIHRAEELLKTDNFGKSDPYVVYFVNNVQVGKTKVIRKSLNPCWDHKATVTYRRGDELTFKVFDSDLLGDDDFHGQVHLLAKDVTRYVGRRLVKCILDQDSAKNKKDNKYVRGFLYISFDYIMTEELNQKAKAATVIQKWFRIISAREKLLRQGMSGVKAIPLALTLAWGNAKKAEVYYQARMALRDKEKMKKRSGPGYMKNTKSASQNFTFVSAASVVSSNHTSFRSLHKVSGEENVVRNKRSVLNKEQRAAASTPLLQSQETKGEIVRAKKDLKKKEILQAELEAERILREEAEKNGIALRKQLERAKKREKIRFENYDKQIERMQEKLNMKQKEIERLTRNRDERYTTDTNCTKVPSNEETMHRFSPSVEYIDSIEGNKNALEIDYKGTIESLPHSFTKKSTNPTNGESNNGSHHTSLTNPPDKQRSPKNSLPPWKGGGNVNRSPRDVSTTVFNGSKMLKYELPKRAKKELIERLSKPFMRMVVPKKPRNEQPPTPAWRGSGGSDTIRSILKVAKKQDTLRDKNKTFDVPLVPKSKARAQKFDIEKKDGKDIKNESKIKKQILHSSMCSMSVATRRSKSRSNKDHHAASNDEMMAIILKELKSMKIAMGELQQQKGIIAGAILKEHTPSKMLSAPNRSIFTTRVSISKEETRDSRTMSDGKKRKVQRKRIVQGQVQTGKCDVMKRKKEKLSSKHTIFVPQKQHVQHEKDNDISLPEHRMRQYGSDRAQATADVRSEEEMDNSIFIKLPSFMTQARTQDSTRALVPPQKNQQQQLTFFEDEQKKIRHKLMNQYSQIDFDEDPLMEFTNYESKCELLEYLHIPNKLFSPLQSGEGQGQNDLPVLDFPSSSNIEHTYPPGVSFPKTDPL